MADPSSEKTLELTDEDLQDLHEDILDRNEDGVREILDQFMDQPNLLKDLCHTEVELEPASRDHELNRLPLTAIHRATLIDSHGILDAILTSSRDMDMELALRASGYTPLHVAACAGVLPAVNYLTSTGANLAAVDVDGRTPVHVAAKQGHHDVISLLCVRGASVNARDADGCTPLHLASVEGHVTSVDFLLARGADVKARDSKGRTPLHAAQVSNVAQVTRSLLDKGSEVNSLDSDGNSPMLIWILSRKQYDHGYNEASLFILFEHKADVNLPNKDGDTALHLAANAGNYQLTKSLLDHGAQIQKVNNLGQSALFAAKSVDVANLLIQNGSDVRMTDSGGNNILHVYAESPDVSVAMVTLAIDAGAELNATNGAGQTPLHCACAAGNREKIELLLERGARNDVIDDIGRSVLHVTIENGKRSVAMWLLQKNGIDVTVRDKCGNSLLHLAARCGDVNIVKMLTSQRAVDLSATNVNGDTPGTLAARHGNMDCLRHILLAGGSVDPEVSAEVVFHFVRAGDAQTLKALLSHVNSDVMAVVDGQSALHLALELESPETADILLDHGADVRKSDRRGRSPLHVCCQRLPACQSVLRRLVDREAINRHDGAGSTPLHYAVARCSLDTLTSFLDAGCRPELTDAAGRSVAHCLLESLSPSDTTDASLSSEEVVARLEIILDQCPECVGQTNNLGRSLLHEAVATGSTEVVAAVLRRLPDINALDHNHVTPLHCACASGQTEIASLLISRGSDVNIADSDNVTPLIAAVLSRSQDLVTSLLRHDADVNIQISDTGCTCLMVAMETKQCELCKYILGHSQPDIGITDARGQSLMHYAARHCSTDVVRSLLDLGADVMARDGCGRRPLHAAVYNEACDVMDCLLSAGADVDAVDDDGNTALHLGSERGSYGHVTLLLDGGANPEARNRRRQTAAHLAATAKDADVMELLLSYHVDVNVTDDVGNTPLAVSILHSNVEISIDLVEDGADVTIQNRDGDTVLHHAMRMPVLNRKLLKMLVNTDKGACLKLMNSSRQTPLDVLRSRTDVDVEGLTLDVGIELNTN